MHSGDNGGGSRAVCCSWDCKSSSSGYNEAKLVEAFGTYGSIDKVTAPKELCQQGTGVVVFKHRRSATRAVAGWREDSELNVWRHERDRKDGFPKEDASVETTASGEGGLTSEEDLQTANKVTTEEQVESQIETLHGVKTSSSENVEAGAHKRSRREGREKKKEKKRRKKEKSEKRDKSKERKSREQYSAKSDDESRKSELVEQKRRRKDDRDKRRDNEVHSDRHREKEARHKQEDSSDRHREDDGDERYCYRDVDVEGSEHDRRGRYRDDDCFYDRNDNREKDYRQKDRDKRKRRDGSDDAEDHRRSHRERNTYKEDNTSCRSSHEQRRKRYRDRADGVFDDKYKDRNDRPSRKEDGESRRSYKGEEENHSSRRSHYRDDEPRSADDFRHEGNHRKRPSARHDDRSDRDYRNRGSLDWSKGAFPPYTLHPMHYSMYGYGYFGQEMYPHAGWYRYHGTAVADGQQKHPSLPKDSPEHSHEPPVEPQAKVDEDAVSGGLSSSAKSPVYLDNLRKLLSGLSVSADLAGPEAYGEYLRFMADMQIEVPDVEPSELPVTVDSPDDDLTLEADPEAVALLRSQDVVERIFPPLLPDLFEDALKLCKQTRTE